jgi:hypothetical protein
MKKHFKTRLEAMDWIAGYAEDEAQFEVLREQIHFNFIYSGTYFVELEESEAIPEIVWLGK